jgi:hypothetical protein
LFPPVSPLRRLWGANVDGASLFYDPRSLPLTLLTPARTLRGHQEALTSLQLIGGSTGAPGFVPFKLSARCRATSIPAACPQAVHMGADAWCLATHCNALQA